jgi:8-oxo-dGTP diphosphatase
MLNFNLLTKKNYSKGKITKAQQCVSVYASHPVGTNRYTHVGCNKKMIKVTAAILEREGRIMIARRKPGKHLEGYWEFPGGKIEGDESPQECLIRELKEELSITVELQKYIGETVYHYPEKSIQLIAYSGVIVNGEITLNDHDRIEWVDMESIHSYKIAPADVPLIKLYY